MNSSSSFKCVRFRNNSGLTILSATPAIPPQIATTTIPRTQCPLNVKNSAAGTHTSADPTTGTSEKNAMTTPQKIGAEIPPIVNAIPPSSPCIPAITSATATLAKISSRDSFNMSCCIDSSKGSRCRVARTTSSPSRNMKNSANIRMKRFKKNVNKFLTSLAKLPAMNPAIFSAPCRSGCEKSVDLHASGSCCRTHATACAGNAFSGSSSAS